VARHRARRVLEGASEEDDDWKIGHPLVFPGMLRKLYFEQMERVEAGQDPICVYRDPAVNSCIELPMEREKFGGARAFRETWLRESSIRYSPIRDEVLRLFGDAA
jgi:5,5'-dehydrodivanillate O-demethylase